MSRPQKLLPLYYHVLDDDPIADLLTRLLGCSSSDEEESFSQICRPKFTQVHLCLEGITLIDARRSLPLETSTDLWSRIWAWIHFLDTYRENLLLRDEELSELYDIFLPTALILRRDSAAAKVIDSTPQFHVFIFRLWRRYLEDPHIVDEKIFIRFCESLRDIPGLFSSDQHFEEALEGSGGTRASLAALIVKHIHHLRRRIESDVVCGRLLFIIPAVQKKSMDDTPFSVALVDHGIVKCLTAAACLFTCATGPPVRAGSGIPPFLKTDVARSCANALLNYLDTPYRQNLCVECLRAGGFRLFSAPVRELHFLAAFLHRLTYHLVYFSILSELETGIVDCEILKPVRADSFSGSPLADDWTAFWSILENRRALVMKYLNRVKPAPRACDNLA
ncbi:hypothetical protein DFH06DRAFT_1297901, partial [Mycena polygramma]